MRFIVLFVAGFIVLGSQTANAQVPESQAGQLTKQIRQKELAKRDLLRKLYPLVAKKYESGVMRLEPVVRTQNMLAEAELAIVERAADRVAVLENGLQKARSLEDSVKQQFEVGRVDGERLLCAAAARQALVIRLALEKSGEKEITKHVRSEFLKLREILQRQRESLVAKHEQGAGDSLLEHVLKLHDDLMHASIRCGRTSQERVAAATKVLEFGKFTEAVIKTQLEMGRSDGERMTLATAARIKLELALLRQKPQSADLKVEQREKLNEFAKTYRSRLAPIQAKYERGFVLLKDLHQAMADVAMSQLPLQTERADRLAVFKQLVEYARRSNDVVTVELKLGRADGERVMQSQVILFDAELALLREQLRWAK